MIKKILSAVLALSVCAGFAGCANEIEYKSPEQLGGASSSVSDNSSKTDDSSKVPDDSSSVPDEPSSTPDDSGSVSDKPPVSNLTVKENDGEYFSKCAFVGEAICSGMSYVNDIADENIYTQNSAHVHDIADTSWTVDGVSKTLPDALYSADRKYIYIWIGPNDLTSYNPNSFAEKYEELVEKITYANPMAYVGIISVAPVSASYEQELGGDTIANYNMKLAELVDKLDNNRVYFFNLVAVLGDSNGHLKSEFDTGDGLHMTPSAYRKVAEYLFQNQIHPYLSDFEVDLGDSSATDESVADDSSATDESVADESVSEEATE